MHAILLFSIAEYYLCLMSALMEIKYHLLTYLLTHLLTQQLGLHVRQYLYLYTLYSLLV